MLKHFWNDFKRSSLKDRGLSLVGATLGISLSYAAWYTGFLATKGPEVTYRHHSNPEPWAHYGNDFVAKWPRWCATGELDTTQRPRAGPKEAWDAVEQHS